MALIADSMDWEPQGGDEPDAFVIRLRAESEADVPDLPLNVIWDKVPLRLVKADD